MTGEIIDKMIELSNIKKEYFEDIIAGKTVETDRIKRIILALDEEFLENIRKLKKNERIDRLEQLDTSLYPQLVKLKITVEELTEMDMQITKLRNRRKLVIK